MTEVQTEKKLFPLGKKREIDWAQYLDFTRFIEIAEIENEKLAKFRKDFMY